MEIVLEKYWFWSLGLIHFSYEMWTWPRLKWGTVFYPWGSGGGESMALKVLKVWNLIGCCCRSCCCWLAHQLGAGFLVRVLVLVRSKWSYKSRAWNSSHKEEEGARKRRCRYVRWGNKPRYAIAYSISRRLFRSLFPMRTFFVHIQLAVNHAIKKLVFMGSVTL